LSARRQWRQTGFVSYGADVTSVGLFGGTFDPPHVGHLVTAVNVRHALALDRMLLMVANAPWQKVGTRTITPAADRLAMVEAAVDGVDGIEASDLELRRGGLSYTADTIADLRTDGFDEVFLVLGSDAAAGLDTWERVDEVRATSTIVVVDRPGEGLGRSLPDGFSWRRVEVPRLEVSSTDLRRRVDDGRPLDYLLPKDVIACIRARGLFLGET
jgi:nicotinate-nucleotide adenylyltransferase